MASELHLPSAVLLAAGTAAFVLIACGGGSDPPTAATATPSPQPNETPSASPATPTATRTSTATPEQPSLRLAQLYFSVDALPGGTEVLRFVAQATNTSTRNIAGSVFQWTAFDSTNAIVGSFTHNAPVIAAGEAYVYVGGAGGTN